jgi:hypothetical protein
MADAHTRRPLADTATSTAPVLLAEAMSRQSNPELIQINAGQALACQTTPASPNRATAETAMATLIVTTKDDVVNSSDGVLSLREALAAADATPTVADTISFNLADMGGNRIVLAGSELTVDSDVAMNGGTGVTIDASQQSRVLLVQDGTAVDHNLVTLDHMTITGGAYTSRGGGILASSDTSVTLTASTVSGNRTEGFNAPGGGIFSYDTVTLTRSTVSGNSTEGTYAAGGGICASSTVTLTDSIVSGNSTEGDGGVGGGIYCGGDVTLIGSTVSGNSTEGLGSRGGGIFSGMVTLTDSTVSDNHTTGDIAGGGGIYSSSVILTDSTVSDNHTTGDNSAGGGIDSFRTVTITNSTVSGNSTEGVGSRGGGILAVLGPVTLTDSTISGNSTSGDIAPGGGIYALRDSLTLTDSTISGNSTAGRGSDGGGVCLYAGLTAKLANSIVAGNSVNDASSIGPDFSGMITSSNGHNIFGSEVSGNAAGDLENVPTSLLFAGGLADNGGPTQTIALRDAADNPALGGADPADAPATDQRGVARPQPDGTNPDIGAFELKQTSGGGPTLILGTNQGEVLLGTEGPDLMRGFGGNDTLRGLGGADQLFGGAGNDVLYGKGGLDRLQGDAGADRFALRLLSDAPAGGPAYDEILDFSRLQHDRIDLSQLDAVAGTSGNQAFRFIGDDPFTRAGQVHAEATADGDFLVSGNVDRDLGADFAFVVQTGVAKLVATDFLL